MSVEDQQTLKIMEETAVKIDGHYQVALPWRKKPPCLPNNRQLAESRIRLCWRNDYLIIISFFVKYVEAVKEYITKGYARKVPDDKLDPDGKSIRYIPHHAVLNPHKSGKIRVVYDCAAKFKGTSLNDQLLHGPILLNNFVGVLIWFRKEPIAVIADTEAIFHKDFVSPTDSDVLRFLWWPNNDLRKKQQDH